MVDLLVALEPSKEARIDSQVTPPQIVITLGPVRVLADAPAHLLHSYLIYEWVLRIKGVNDDLFLFQHRWRQLILINKGLPLLLLLPSDATMLICFLTQ